MVTILVVEDDKNIAGLLQEVLTDDGYAVEVAANGREALATLQHSRPAAILSDIMMPMMSGLELCHQLTHDEHYHTIPIILMSAGKTPPHEDGCRYAAFLPKPFLILDVLALLERLLTST